VLATSVGEAHRAGASQTSAKCRARGVASRHSHRRATLSLPSNPACTSGSALHILELILEEADYFARRSDPDSEPKRPFAELLGVGRARILPPEAMNQQLLVGHELAKTSFNSRPRGRSAMIP
jgi:hypothetical protein